MRKIDFWEWNRPAAERQAINEAADELEGLQDVSAVTMRHVQLLLGKNAAAREEIERLHATVQVLAELLIEAGVTDRATLAARVDEALVARQRPAAPQGAPGRDLVACVRCKERVAVDTTLLTEDGPICEECCRPSDLTP